MHYQNMWYEMFVQFAILYGIYLYRSPIDAVSLVICIDHINHFEGKLHWVNHMRWSQTEKMERVQKIIDFETLVQEIDEEKVTVEESWPAKGKINFN